MILVTIGTSEPFDRLLGALDLLPRDEELVLQCGTSCLIGPRRARRIDYLASAELAAEMRRARAIVMHAGVGSIITALEQGRRPIVVPRLHRFGEAVDDHQLALGRRLADIGLVRLVEDLALLPAAVRRPPRDRPSAPSGDGLVGELRSFLRGAVAG